MIPKLTLSSELQLLLLCARSIRSADASYRVRGLLSSGVDWGVFLATSANHGVTPLVHAALAGLADADVPRDVRDELARRCRLIAARNLLLAVRTCEVVVLLENEGIQALGYKGAPLAIQAYGSLSLREFGDVDILVDRRDYSAACRVFRDLGCSEADWGWECSYQAPQLGVTIDLHRELSPDNFPVRFSFQEAWARTEIIPILSRSARTMSPEDMLVVLAVQLMKDVWSPTAVRLSKLCDIAELIRSSRELQWKRVISTARELGVSRMLAVSLALARDMLGVVDNLPEMRGQRSHSFDRLVEFVWSRLIIGDVEFRYLGFRGRRWFQFCLRERWRHRLQPIASEILSKFHPNTRDYSLVSLPGSLRHLYFLVRPFRLFRDHVLLSKRDKR